MVEPQINADPTGAVTIFCTQCGKAMRVAPLHLQVTVACPHCGQVLEPWRVAQATKPGNAPPAPPPMVGYPRPMTGALSSRSKVLAGVLGIVFGSLGIHRFYLGYIGIGILQIILTLATFGAAGIWGFVEGILCLTGHLRDVDGLPLRD